MPKLNKLPSPGGCCVCRSCYGGSVIDIERSWFENRIHEKTHYA